MKRVLLGVLVAAVCVAQVPEYQAVKAEKFRPREGLGNVMQKIQAGKEVTVAYFGGSITAANGWRPQTTAWLSKQYPGAKFKEIHAAIGGTGSNLGVFRMGHDVLQHKPDLIFVEFAVNDGGAKPEDIWKSMEGIVRQAWKQDGRTDLMFVYTIISNFTNDLKKGECPRSAGSMEMLADFYGIPSVNFAQEVTEQLVAGKLVMSTTEKPADGVIWFCKDSCHPTEQGHRIYTDMLAQYIPLMEKSKPVDHAAKLAKAFVPGNLESAKMVPVTESMLTGEWTKLPETDSMQKAFGKRMGQVWKSGKPGSKLTFRFKGTMAGVYNLLTPAGGKIQVTVDGKPQPKPYQLFDSYCTSSRIGSLAMAQGLDPAQTHEVTIELLAEQPDRTILLPKLKSPDELKQPKYNGTEVFFAQLMLIGDLAK